MSEVNKKYDMDPFLLKKWERVFNAFFDRDSSQTVDKHDFYLVTRKVRDIYGAESAQMDYAKESLNALWEGLIQLADKDKNEVITLDEWVNALKSTNGKMESTWFINYMTYMFKLFDVSADKVLDIAEYTDGMCAYGFPEKEAQEAFRRFAVDEQGKPVRHVDLPHFKRLWTEYFFSTDQKLLGNNLFGLIKD